MKLHFKVSPNATFDKERALVYRSNENSFDTLPSRDTGITSVLLDDLNLEIDGSDRVIGVWGLCPIGRWKEMRLTPPTAHPGELLLVANPPLLAGVSVSLNKERYLPVYADYDSGWVQIKDVFVPFESVQIYPGVIVELSNDGQICSLWLRPERV